MTILANMTDTQRNEFNAAVDPWASSRGISRQLEKISRNMERARDQNAYVLPDYGSGPSAGKTVPTVTPSNAALSGKTQVFRLNDGAGQDFLMATGGIPVQSAGSFYGFPVVVSGPAPANIARGAVGFAVEFVTDDDGFTISLPFVEAALRFRVLVDGQFVSRTPAATSSTNTLINVVFGSTAAKGRTVRFEMEGPQLFQEIRVAPNRSVWKPPSPDFVRGAWLGDSWGSFYSKSISGAPFAHDNYAGITMRNLGVTDCCQISVGGTGFASDNAGTVATAVRYSQRLNDLVILQALPGGVDFAVLQGSINDQNKSASDITAEVIKCITGSRSILGAGAPIVVLGVASGSLGTGTSASANCIAAENAVLAGVRSVNDPMTRFVPFSTRTRMPILTGDGTTGSSLLYMSPDLYHPTGGVPPTAAGGFEYVSNAVTPLIQAALNDMRR